MIVYLDTSAAFKLAFEEDESAAVAQYVRDRTADDLVSAWLLHTEMYCAARRQGADPSGLVADVLARVELLDVSRYHFQRAATLSGRLRSGDALHLAIALDAKADAMLVYDAELAAAAASVGLQVIAPR